VTRINPDQIGPAWWFLDKGDGKRDDFDVPKVLPLCIVYVIFGELINEDNVRFVFYWLFQTMR
jgi:hypothetical protein